jgi:hypothetical protein
LDVETEKFLWRRKADLELILRELEHSSNSGAHKNLDSAHLSGHTQAELTNMESDSKSKHAKKSITKKPNSLGPNSAEHTVKKSTTESSHFQSHGVDSLAAFMKGATAAQLAQISMIRKVFEKMDADKDGILSVGDIKAYFRTIGRNSSDAIARKWIRDRDIDQDGAVSLVEFVSSYAHQLDPASKLEHSSTDGHKVNKLGSNTTTTLAMTVSPVVVAFGTLRLGCSSGEIIDAIDAATEYVQRMIDSPSVQSFWRIHVEDKNYHRRIGRLFGGEKIMLSLGFSLEDNGKILAVRDPNGKSWESLPQDVKKSISSRLNELHLHRQSLQESSISNVAAGITHIRSSNLSLSALCAYLFE